MSTEPLLATKEILKFVTFLIVTSGYSFLNNFLIVWWGNVRLVYCCYCRSMLTALQLYLLLRTRSMKFSSKSHNTKRHICKTVVTFKLWRIWKKLDTFTVPNDLPNNLRIVLYLWITLYNMTWNENHIGVMSVALQIKHSHLKINYISNRILTKFYCSQIKDDIMDEKCST
jgi:hypothetical protein